MKSEHIIQLILDGLIAFGTIFLALIAIYGERVKRALFRPKVKASLKNEPPYVESLEHQLYETEFAYFEGTSSQSNEYRTTIRLRVDNNGASTALNCQGIVETIWCKRAINEKYYKMRTLTPSQLDWYNDEKEFSIVPSIPSYLEIARIQKTEERSEETKKKTSSTDQSENQSDLYLSISEPGSIGLFIKLGKGTFVIPLIIYADNLSAPIKYYVEIFWDGNDPSNLEDSSFYASLLSSSELPKEINK